MVRFNISLLILVAGLLIHGPVLHAAPSSWELFHRNLDLTELNFIHENADGGFTVGGLRGFDYWLLRLDATGRVIWERAIGSEYFESKLYAALKDGGFLLAGWDDNGLMDIHLLKLTAQGQIAWQAVYGMKSTLTYPLALTGTRDGGAAVVGYNPVQAYGGKGRMIFLKISPAGKIQIQKSYDVYIPTSIELLPDGGYIVGTWNFTALRLTASGNVLWQRNMNVHPWLFEDRISAVHSEDGGFYLAGTIGDVNVPTDILIVKLDDSGNVLWEKTYGGTGDDIMISIQPVTGGGFVFGGSTNSFKPLANLRAWLIRADDSGNVLWQTSILDRTGSFYAGGVYATSDGGYALAGRVETGLAVIRTDAGGRVQTSCKDMVYNTHVTPRTYSAGSVARHPSSTPIHLLSKQTFTPTVFEVNELTSSLCEPVLNIDPFPVYAGGRLGLSGRSLGNMQNNSKVIFGNTDLGTATRWNQYSISIPIPANAVTSPVFVHTGARTSNTVEAVVLPTPPAALLPDSGPAAGGTRVALVIPSRFLDSSFQILFGNNAVGASEIPSNLAVLCTTPPGNGTVDVSVTNGQETALLGRFSYK